MPGGFAPRFAVEAGFLILLGVGAGYADLRPIVIVALLAGGWISSRSSSSPCGARRRVRSARTSRRRLLRRSRSRGGAGQPAEEPPAEDEYPLRAGAGEKPSEEVEEYTRVLGAPAADERAARSRRIGRC